jgi:hypothetical protein
MSKGLTDDPTHPDLGVPGEGGQNKMYLVLSEEERAKGFVRPLRRSYVHDKCGALTTMSLPLCETYARLPTFYNATYCVGCGTHFPVGEFKWDEDGAVVGS